MPLPLGEVSPQVTERAHAAALSAKVSSATRNFAAVSKSSPFGGAGTPSGVTERVGVPLGELSPQATEGVNPAPNLQIKFASFLRFTAIFSNFAGM